MSFDGAQNTPNDHKPLTRMGTPTQRLRRAFELFQRNRKNNPLLQIDSETQSGSAVCGCGQRKNHSAKHCFACADARHILKQKFKVTEYTGFHMKERAPKIFPAPNKRVPDKVGQSFSGDHEIDQLVNIYEKELSSYG